MEEKLWYEFDYGVKFAFYNRCKGVWAKSYEEAERFFKDTIISEQLKTAHPSDVELEFTCRDKEGYPF